MSAMKLSQALSEAESFMFRYAPAEIAGRSEWLVSVWEERRQPFFAYRKKG